MKQIAVNIVCMIASLLCVIMIIVSPFKNGGGFGLENFIGVMATFIGICATMMVGLQIYNHLEIRKVTKRVKNLQSLEKKQKKIIKKLRFAQKGVSDLFRLEARIRTDNYVPVCLAVSVIIAYEDGLKDKDALKDLLVKYKKLWDYCERNKFNTRLLRRYLTDFEKMHFDTSIEKNREIIIYHTRFLNLLQEEKIKINKRRDNNLTSPNPRGIQTPTAGEVQKLRSEENGGV